jgi:hypothetical protein
VPDFPVITTTRKPKSFLLPDEQRAVLDSIPWEKRGLFLALAFETFRLSEGRAFDLADFRAPDMLRLSRAFQGHS